MTLEKAAEKLDIYIYHLSEIERGKSRPSFEPIIQMAAVFDVSSMLLFMFEREETGEKSLRRKICTLVDKYDAQKLGQIYCYLAFMLGP